MMKKIGVLVLIALLGSFSGMAQNDNTQNEKEANRPVISFKETTHNYGTIEYKGDGTCEFSFENTGKEPLLLTKVRSSCGCTVPKTWPKDPIKSGETSSIKVKYNTRIKGNFTKSIRVYSNAKNSPTRLIIKGKVVMNKE